MTKTTRQSGEKSAANRFCPICGKVAQQDSRPFCSPRCKAVDLNRWLSGAYAVPQVEMEPDDVVQLEEALEEAMNAPDRERP